MLLPRWVLRAPTVFAAFVALVSLTLASSVPRASASVPVLVIDGKGWGHGVGMAQDGAFWMAKSGAKVEQVLAHFYPGTSLGSATGTVRVAVRGPGPDAVLSFPAGGEVRDAPSGQQSPGFPVKVQPGGQVRIQFDGSRYSVTGGTPTGTAASASAATADQHQVALRASRSGARDQVVPGPDSSTTSPLPTLPGQDSTTTTSQPPTSTTSSTSPPTTAAPGPTIPSTPSSTAPSGPSSTTTTTSPVPGTTPPAPGQTQPSQPGSTAPAPSDPGQPAGPPPGPAAATSPRPLWAAPSGNATIGLPERGREYRGLVEAVSAGGPAVRIVNQVDVETYLKGMGEVRDPGWPLAALQTQAVAARTYALRAMSTGGELCDDDRCQVYLGAQVEYAAMNKAVDSTAKKVVVFGGTFASTVYSANAGGFSATAQEGFGSPSGYPYLQAAPYTTGDPMPWTVRVGLPDLGARLGYPGTVADVRIAQAGPSGRALTVELDGSAGAVQVPGLRFASAFGLRSTLFALHVESADAAPPPPAAADLIQAPPDQAAAIATADPAVAAAPVPHVEGAIAAGSAPSRLVPRLQPASDGTRRRSLVFTLLGLLALLSIGAVATPTGRRLAAPVAASRPVQWAGSLVGRARLPAGMLRFMPTRWRSKTPVDVDPSEAGGADADPAV